MKTFRLAFLLGILSTSLVGCNNSGGSHTITFNGTNCYMKSISGDDPIIEPLKVKDGESPTFRILVDDPAHYVVPTEVDVKGEAKQIKYARSSDSLATLSFDTIKSDISITAVAPTPSEVYSITYYSDETCEWIKDNPASVMKNETFTAYIDVKEGYSFTKDNFTVFIEGSHAVLPSSQYSFENNALTVKGESVTNNVYIYAGYVAPAPGEYDVNFTMEHATPHFPAKQTQGMPLEGYFVADEKYRVPTKDELAPKDESQQPYDGKIIKIGEGVRHPLRPNQFYYESYIDSDSGRSIGYIYIFDLLELLDATSIEIGGTPIEQVTVTFHLEGEDVHWNNPSKTTEDRYGTIDKGDEFGNAEKAASGTERPIKDGEQWSFDAWQDNSGTSYYSPTEINEDVTVTAKFKEKEYKIYTDTIYHATITGLPTEPIHWHDPIGSELKPIKITAAEGYKLPTANLVKVTMSQVGETDWIEIPFNYIRSSDGKEANFYISENIVEGNIKITLSAEKYVSVTFNPGEGHWKDGTAESITVSLPSGSTYGEALDLTGKGGNPVKTGATFYRWMNGATVVTLDQEITVDGNTITAEYTTITTFANDTWENVIAHANADDLKETYGDTIYIGATRDVIWSNDDGTETKTYKVRVIDSDYDYYYKDGVATASALTFEFVDLIGEGMYGKLPDKAIGKNSWHDSVYRSTLDDFYEGVKKGTAGFEVKSAIKHTLHGYVTEEEAKTIDPRQQFETQEHFFPLSGAEIGIAADNGWLNNTTYKTEQRENEALPGGIAYYYYQNQATSRSKKLNDVVTSYWLRSPHVYKEKDKTDPDLPDTSEAYWIDLTPGSGRTGSPTDYNGGQGGSSSCDTPHGYMAAFCI